jgi:hypothetical protein
MAELNIRKETVNVNRVNIERLDESLDIMERHASAMAESEEAINESLRKWDREYKNERFHSVPKPRKHTR